MLPLTAVTIAAGLSASSVNGPLLRSSVYSRSLAVIARCEQLCDFNHDSKPDRLDLIRGANSSTVRVTLGGIGTHDIAPVNLQGEIFAADMNGDKNLDVVWQSKKGLFRKIVWLGDGKGGFVLAAQRKPLDFAALPSLPYVPSSSSSAQSTTWTASSAEKRSRTQISIRRVGPVLPVLTGSQKRKQWTGDAAPIRFELLQWVARTTNAPPSSSFFS